MCRTPVNFCIQIPTQLLLGFAALRAPCTACSRPFRLIKALLLSSLSGKAPREKNVIPGQDLTQAPDADSSRQRVLYRKLSMLESHSWDEIREPKKQCSSKNKRQTESTGFYYVYVSKVYM